MILQIAMRYIIAAALSGPFSFTREERVLSQVVYASGLPAFVMSQLPQIFDPGRTHFVDPQIYPDLCMPIVLGTILFSGLLGLALARRALTGMEAVEAEVG